jgi:hypothetical protein
MVFSTLLTLFLVPVVYVLLDGLQARLRLRRPAEDQSPSLSPVEAS